METNKTLRRKGAGANNCVVGEGPLPGGGTGWLQLHTACLHWGTGTAQPEDMVVPDLVGDEKLARCGEKGRGRDVICFLPALLIRISVRPAW